MYKRKNVKKDRIITLLLCFVLFMSVIFSEVNPHKLQAANEMQIDGSIKDIEVSDTIDKDIKMLLDDDEIDVKPGQETEEEKKEDNEQDLIYSVEQGEKKEVETVVDWEWAKDNDIQFDYDKKNKLWYLSLSANELDEATKITRENVQLQMLGIKVDITLQNKKQEQMHFLSWNCDVIPLKGTYKGIYKIEASLPKEYVFAKDVPKIFVELRVGQEEVKQIANFPGTRTQFKDAKELDDALKTHQVTAVNPENVTVNLFDYGVNQPVSLAGTDSDLLEKNNKNTPMINGADANSYNFGINANRLLTFGDSMIHAGFWNLGAGAGRPWSKRNTNMKNIVNKNLGDDGYPNINVKEAIKDQTSINLTRDNDIWGINVAEKDNGTRADGMNLSSGILSRAGGIKNSDGTWNTSGINSSLSYLFDPSQTNDYKSAYKNIKGLFQMDDAGYYYYYARKNFAELDTTKVSEGSDGAFNLYDGPAMWRTDGGYLQTGGTTGTDSETGNFNGDMSLGNFYPFNSARQVFDSLDENNRLTSSTKTLTNDGGTNRDPEFNPSKAPDMKKNQATGEEFFINHHMGMSVNMNFRQPVGGVINSGTLGKRPMTFQFSGDDDVWVFIDGVLVLDLGGIHSELYGTINFQTGEVNIGQSWRTGGKFPDEVSGDYPGITERTTLKDCFIAAGKSINNIDWKGNTFVSNTSHEIKMFYLERGNYDSSLALKFNLQPLLPQEVKKVDQNGDPLGDVEFNMYPAELTNASDPDGLRCANIIDSNNQAKYIKKANDTTLATLKTDADTGRAQFYENVQEGKLYNFADNYVSDTNGRFYILEETRTPEGYRPLPIPIVLEFNPKTTMLSVANRWQTGSYASFNSHILGNSTLSYAQFDESSLEIKPTSNKVDIVQQKDGLVCAFPMLYQSSSAKWEAMYGDNTEGFHAQAPANATAEEWRNAALHAILYQCLDEKSPNWFLEYDTNEHRLKGTLSDLPGRADRYLLNNPNGDMRMVYAIITKEGLAKLGISGGTSEEKYQQLRQYIISKGGGKTGVDEAVKKLNLVGDIGVRDFSLLNIDEFNRDFRSLIYIPNEQRELRVQKVDQDGTGVNGAEFGLFDETNKQVATGKTAQIDGQDGVLIFTPKPVMTGGSVKNGYAEMKWVNNMGTDYYYLKETKAPSGYKINNTKVPIIVGIYSIYADAGTKDDGVTVMAGVGKLAQTMTKYASDGDVNITLRDISAIGQTQESGKFSLTGWSDMKLNNTSLKRQMNLHYGINAVVDYGLHDQDGGKNLRPFFVTDTGFIRTRVIQNYEALTHNEYHSNAENNANKDDIGDTDITSLFSLLNTVVVTDKTTKDTKTGELTIRKIVTGENITNKDYTRNFNFSINFVGTGDKKFYFYGTDKSGYVKNGDVIPLHHDESITILGLPEGTRFTVAEQDESASGWYVIPRVGKYDGVINTQKVFIAAFTNQKTKPSSTGNLTINKTVTGTEGDQDDVFHFRVKLTDKDGAELSGYYSYVGTDDNVGQIKSSDVIAIKGTGSVTIMELPANTKYSVTEVEQNQDGYETKVTNPDGVISENNTSEVSFNNHRDKKGDITVRKKWVLDNGRKKTDSITVSLYKDGTKYDSQILNEANKWTYTWKGVVTTAKWEVKEEDVPDGFTCNIKEDNNGVFIITNNDTPPSPTPTPGKTNVSVRKNWILDDGRDQAKYITVVLYKNGKKVDSKKLNSQNDWYYIWTDLDANAIWEVKERDIPKGFLSEVKKKSDTDFIITNNDKPYDDNHIKKKTPKDKDKQLPHTGMDWWSVWVLWIVGLCLIFMGIRREKSENDKR